MSVFSFPRLHVKGLIVIHVGTANNDDYSGYEFPPGSPLAGQPLRLADSNHVRVNRFDMSDDEWIAWVQSPHPFVKTPSQQAPAPVAAAAALQGHAAVKAAVAAASTRAETVRPTKPADASAAAAAEPTLFIPGEWNFYGDMGMDMQNVRVIGVQYQPGAPVTADDPWLDAELSFKNRPGDTGRSTGMLIDVNAEDVPCSQIFADALTLEQDGAALFQGKPSKSATRWINFQRNTQLSGPNGAAAAFQSVVPIAELQGQPILELFAKHASSQQPLQGLVFRYYIFRALQEINTFKYDEQAWFSEMMSLYERQGLNPDYGEIIGTIAPWYEGEMQSTPTGRLLDPTGNTIPAKDQDGKCHGNGCEFRLAPAMLEVAEDRISVDFSGTFPDEYSNPHYNPLRTGDNPKRKFGPVELLLRSSDTVAHSFGEVPYAATAAGDARGWVFDFPLSESIRGLIEGGRFCLHHAEHGDLLAETEYFIASDQSCIFGDQGPVGSTATLFTNDGPADSPATIRVFRTGRELTANDPLPPITVWEYDATPNQDPGPRRKLAVDFKPGDELCVDVGKSGNRFFTFTLDGQPEPPEKYKDMDLMTVPMINLRLLPNDEDFSEYFRDPSASQPVGNDQLTFGVIYEKVLRNYYLLYPGMNKRIPLNDPDQWAGAEMARRLMMRIQRSMWDKAEYMPRTRDLSHCRRQLLTAWCLKFLTPDG